MSKLEKDFKKKLIDELIDKKVEDLSNIYGGLIACTADDFIGCGPGYCVGCCPTGCLSNCMAQCQGGSE